MNICNRKQELLNVIKHFHNTLTHHHFKGKQGVLLAGPSGPWKMPWSDIPGSEALGLPLLWACSMGGGAHPISHTFQGHFKNPAAGCPSQVASLKPFYFENKFQSILKNKEERRQFLVAADTTSHRGKTMRSEAARIHKQNHHYQYRRDLKWGVPWGKISHLEHCSTGVFTASLLSFLGRLLDLSY